MTSRCSCEDAIETLRVHIIKHYHKHICIRLKCLKCRIICMETGNVSRRILVDMSYILVSPSWLENKNSP